MISLQAILQYTKSQLATLFFENGETNGLIKVVSGGCHWSFFFKDR